MFIGTVWCTGLSPKVSKDACWVVLCDADAPAHKSTGRLQFFLQGLSFSPPHLAKGNDQHESFLSTLYKLAYFSTRVWFIQFFFLFYVKLLVSLRLSKRAFSINGKLKFYNKFIWPSFFHKQYNLFSLPPFVSVVRGQEIKSSLIVWQSVTPVLFERVISKCVDKKRFYQHCGEEILVLQSKVCFPWH